MRRFLSISLIALALVVFAAPAAYAVDCPTGQYDDGSGTCVPDAGIPTDTSGNAYTQGAIDSANAASQAGVAAQAAQAQATIDQAAKAPVPPPTSPDDAFNWVMQKILQLFAWLVGVAALTLNYAVYYTVVTMGAYVKNLNAVGATWQILRDVGNIMLIFGFLAVGITTILNVDWYGGGKKMLPWMLVAAVFLNFSLFFTEVIIDTGNLFATQFYTQINGTTQTVSVGSFSDVTALGTQGIAGKIMSQLGLAAIYGEAAKGSGNLFVGSYPWLIGFMGILLFIVLAFVMFSLAFVLIARFVILIFLIILAPVGFAGLAVPMLAKRAGQWWDKLFEQVVTAPILLLMLYIALRIITAGTFLTGFNGGNAASWTGFTTNNFAGFAGVLLSFLVAMGLLIAVVIQSKKLSAFGAQQASQLAGKLSFGAVSLGGRATLGLAGNALAGKRMQSWARTGGLGGLLLKGAVLGGKGLRSSTYDVRNFPGATAGLGMIGVDAGKGATFTAKQAHEAQYGVKPVREFLQHSAEERAQAGREMDFKDAQSAIEKEKADLAAGTITQAQYDANVAPHEKVITESLSKMTTKQLEELGGIKSGVDALVNNLSPQQFEALMKSDKLNDIEKGKIKDARYRTLTNAVTSGNAPAIKKAVNSLSKGELESMPATTLTNPLVLDQLSDKQRETITDSKERTAAEKDLVRNSSPVGSVETIFNTTGGGVAGAAAVAGSPNFARLTVPQLAKLDKSILTQRVVAEKLTTATLIELQEQKKLTPAEMIDIGNHIRASATANAKTKDYVTTGPGAALWA